MIGTPNWLTTAAAEGVEVFRPTNSSASESEIENANYSIPPLKLDHLFNMSDHTGIFQHAIYNVPNYHEGYCTDDNARAFKFSIPRPLPQGDLGDGDLHGGQQFTPLMNIEIPLSEGFAVHPRK